MNPESTIARRYLFSRKHISLISTLTLISICGVTLGTALLIIVLSVFNGFFDVIQSLLLSNDPDIRIESAEGRTVFMEDDQFQMIDNMSGVVAVSPYLEGKSLVAHQRSRDKVVTVKGIYPEKFQDVADVFQNITSGSVSLEVKDQMPGLLISERIANSQRLNTGDNIALLSAAGMQRALTQFSGPRGFNFEIRGTYMQSRILDEEVIYIDMPAARRLFSERSAYSAVDIRLEDSGRANRMKRELEQQLGNDYKVSTWYDLKRSQYDVMNMEKWGAYFVLMIIVIIAVLNIAGSLTMVVIQKKRDIGVLLSMGFSKKNIRNVFIRQGWYIGLIGCVFGGALGLGLSWAQDRFGMVKLAGAESFIIDAYPVVISGSDVLLVLLASLVLCIAASWLPASMASRTDPSEAIRYE